MGEKLLWGALGAALMYMYQKAQPQPTYYAPGYDGPRAAGTRIDLPGGWSISLPSSAAIGFQAEPQGYQSQPGQLTAEGVGYPSGQPNY